MGLRTLIVDDTVVYRKILSGIIEEIPDAELAGTAPNGKIALKKILFVKPDLILLDVHMPEMNGIDTLKQIKISYPKISVVMISGIETQSTNSTIEALQSGAIDFIRKPSGKDQQKNIEELRYNLRSVIRLVSLKQNSTLKKQSQKDEYRKETQFSTRMPSSGVFKTYPGQFSVCCIGVSTGGPEALGKLIPMLPPNFPLPVLIVQHMPPLFTKSLAESISRKSNLRVVEASQKDPVKKGVVYIAPGGKHMIVRKINDELVIGLNEEPPENSCRPSVDVLFRSVAANYGNQGVLALILTGMGNDGLNGVRSLKRQKCYCITQSESSCIVYGMPRAVYEAGLSDISLPLNQIASKMVKYTMK
ncbi:MAG TPA: chemotaxis-specific protein-glutamate methyltransferase CheB [Chitinispirillaceae bacterium]|jgi:two-component system chemotaxis response regulator CheB|nr:chemotaxis-specific protein-glutamate methyltransferase CheB [Chitinispirillaceae bacterium]